MSDDARAPTKIAETPNSDERDEGGLSRRDTLKSMAKFAAYTAPAMTVLLAAPADANWRDRRLARNGNISSSSAKKPCTPTPGGPANGWWNNHSPC